MLPSSGMYERTLVERRMGHIFTLDVPGDLHQSLIQEAEQSGLPLEALKVQLSTAADRSERTIIHMGKLEDTR